MSILIKINIVLVFLLLTSSCSSQKELLVPTSKKGNSHLSYYNIIKHDFVNPKVVKNSSGKICELAEIDKNKYVVIIWDNEYKAFGTLNNKFDLLGEWYIFNAKGLLYKKQTYSYDGENLVSETLFKKGKVISHWGTGNIW